MTFLLLMATLMQTPPTAPPPDASFSPTARPSPTAATSRTAASSSTAATSPTAPPSTETEPTSPAGDADAAPQFATGFLYKTLEFEGKRYPYTVFVPPDYTPQRRWPVILFLHGSGERGEDGFLPSEVGIGRAIRRDHTRCPAVVVMPQCPDGTLWTDAMLNMALHTLAQTSLAYNLDSERIYLTGLSMGGAGAWTLAARMPDRLAAVAPLCGFVDNPRVPPSSERVRAFAERLTDIPIWVFHGGQDVNVVPDHSTMMVAELRRRGANVRYTEYPEARHNIWDRAYDDAEFWQWLFRQRRELPAASSQPAQGA